MTSVVYDTTNKPASLRVNAAGELIVAGVTSGGPGGTGDASAANQDEQTALLTLIEAHTANTPTGGATAAKQDTGNTSLAAIDTKLATENTNSALVAAAVSGARVQTNPIVGQAGVAVGAGAVDVKTQRVTLASDDPSLTYARPLGKTITASKTRPGDTTTYASGDILNESASAGTIISFANFARDTGRGALILGAEFILSVAPSTKPEIELWLFDDTITVQNDNATWSPTDADMEKCVGVIDFPSGLFKPGAGNGICSREGLSMHCSCVAGSSTLYAVAVLRNAYVPGANDKFTFRLKVVQD